jgi:hypothetical protein
LGSPSTGRADDSGLELQLAVLRAELERAHFAAAQAHASSLLATRALTARQRNEALELLAIAQIAARDEAAAVRTLSELFTRDPEHTARLRDPGPSVQATFERTRHAAPSGPTIPVTLSALREGSGRVLVRVSLGAGHDAVDTVHVFAHESLAAVSARGSQDDALLEPSHVVAERGQRSMLTLALPAASPNARALAVYVQARAPSGAVLGADGSAAAPLKVRLEPLSACHEHTRSSRRGWLWTSVSLAALGIALGAGLGAR